MGVPKSKEAQLYYRCARQRFDESEILYANDMTTGEVYLAGYGIDCMLKALILESLPEGSRKRMLMSFRGGRAHDYKWLRDQYLERGGARLPPPVAKQFVLVDDWSTDLRYDPTEFKAKQAAAFLKAAEVIHDRIEGRL